MRLARRFQLTLHHSFAIRLSIVPSGFGSLCCFQQASSFPLPISHVMAPGETKIDGCEMKPSIRRTYHDVSCVKIQQKSRTMAVDRPHHRGGTPRRRRPATGDRLLSICSSLGLASIPRTGHAGPGPSTAADNEASTNRVPSTASQRRQNMIRARRVALKMKRKGKALARKARRIAKDVTVKLARKIETCDLSRSAVTAAFTSTVVNVLCGSLVLGATSLVAAGVSVAIAERIRSRRWSRREAGRYQHTASGRTSYLGPPGRSFLVPSGSQQGATDDHVHRRQI